ncbi:MAG TPA: carboxypeptidase-like regulatory domain-containing protein, partial [Verrucomicrobiae bacterium]|nr:carboxypeptidase-like regulatory domain-containing protein [Verrucomicrobiae bacterium]
MKRTALWILPLLVVFASTACLAQSTNAGDIRGSVTDASGALIPGVSVTVTNVNTGVTKTFVTNDSGIYDTDSIVT